MKTIFCLVLSLVLMSCGDSTEKKEPTKKKESTENIDENVNFENVSESQIEERIRNWFGKLGLDKDQKIAVKKIGLPSDALRKPILQLQFQDADMVRAKIDRIESELRILAGASESEIPHQSDGYVEMNLEVANRLIKALFKK